MSYKPPPDFKHSEGNGLGRDKQNMKVILIQIPKKFDISRLNGIEYVPGQINDIAVDEMLPGQMTATYHLGASDLQNSDLKLLMEKDGKTIVGQSFTGFSSVTKSFNVESKPSRYTLPHFEKAGPSTVPMPEGLKVRYTPFGSGTPYRAPQPDSRSKKRKRAQDSLASDDIKQEKKRKKRKHDDSDLTITSSNPTSTSISQGFFSQLNSCVGDSTSLSNDSQRVSDISEETTKQKHKKKSKKSKRHKDEGGDTFSPLTNGSGDMNDSLLSCETTNNSLHRVTKEKKKKDKKVSFSQEDSVFMDSSGDAGKLFIEPNNNSHDFSSDKSLKGSKKKLSSGYSSADTSLDISLPSSNSDVSGKKKKKKHKDMGPNNNSHDVGSDKSLKGSKKNLLPGYSSADTSLDISLPSSNSDVSGKKKKKKHKHKGDDSL